MTHALPAFDLYWAEKALNRPFRPITPREAGVLVQRFLVLAAAATFLLVAILGIAAGRLFSTPARAHVPSVLVAAGQVVREAPRLSVPTVTAPAVVVAPIRTPIVVATPKVATVTAATERASKPARLPKAEKREVSSTNNLFGDLLSGPDSSSAEVPAPKRPKSSREDATPVKDVPVSDTKPIDRMPASKSGVAGLTASSLTLQSGKQVKVGGQLPSGEDLISIDVKRNRIETSARVIVVVPDSDEKQ